jgi:hypothetical protein
MPNTNKIHYHFKHCTEYSLLRYLGEVNFKLFEIVLINIKQNIRFFIDKNFKKVNMNIKL